MPPDLPVLAALPLLAFFIGLPALTAWRRRGISRHSSDVATSLASYAAAVRREGRCLPLEESLRTRLIALRIDEFSSLQLALDVARGDPALLADAAQRLATRLRRRVAFQRKMLARTAPGLRRGAIVASLPPLLVMLLMSAGVRIPLLALSALLIVEMLGCALLWRLAHVEV